MIVENDESFTAVLSITNPDDTFIVLFDPHYTQVTILDDDGMLYVKKEQDSGTTLTEMLQIVRLYCHQR